MRIPISIKQVAYNCTEQRPCWAYAKLIQKENQITKNTIAELYLLNNDGTIICHMSEVVMQMVPRTTLMKLANKANTTRDSINQPHWVAILKTIKTTAKKTQAEQWLLLGDNDAIEESLTKKLKKDPSKFILLKSNKRFSTKAAVNNFVVLCGCQENHLEFSSQVYQHNEKLCEDITKQLKKLNSQTSKPKVWIITSGALAINNKYPINKNQAPFVNLANSITKTYPQYRCTHIDIDPKQSARQAIESLYPILCGDAKGEKLILRGQQCYVPQLEQLKKASIGHKTKPLRPRLVFHKGDNREQLKAHIQSIVSEHVSAVLGIDSTQLNKQQGFFDLGMDSLMAVELNKRLQADLGEEFTLKSTAVFDYPSVIAFSEHIEALIAGTSQQIPQSTKIVSENEPIAIIVE